MGKITHVVEVQMGREHAVDLLCLPPELRQVVDGRSPTIEQEVIFANPQELTRSGSIRIGSHGPAADEAKSNLRVSRPCRHDLTSQSKAAALPTIDWYSGAIPTSCPCPAEP